MSLQVRLTLTYSFLAAVILTVFAIILHTTMRNNLESEMDRRLQVRANQVELTMWPSGGSLRAEDLTSSARLSLAPLAALNAPNLYVQVLDQDGRVVARSDNLQGETLPIDAPSVRSALAGARILHDVTVEDDEQAVRILNVPISLDGSIIGVLQVGQSRQPLQEAMAGLRTQLQLLGVSALAIAGLAGWLVAHRGLRPLRDMAQQAETITVQRNFRRRLRVGQRTDEVGALAATINGLLSTVDQTLQTHREFVADSSHELRNPLLAIRTNLDLLDRVGGRAQRTECIREAREQVARISRLVSDLLVLARTEAEQVVEQRSVALRPLVARVLHETRQRADGRHIRAVKTESIAVLGDEERLGQILGNLLDNALKHTPPGGTISVGARGREGWACVTVADNGEGIAPEDLPRIFERFYRSGTGHAGNDGTGLGLAIVKHLTEAHGGRVTVESELGLGSRFTIWLPRVRDTSGSDREPVGEAATLSTTKPVSERPRQRASV